MEKKLVKISIQKLMKEKIKYEKPKYFLHNQEYYGVMPTYFNIEEIEWIQLFKLNWELIRDEILSNILPDNFPIPNLNPNLVNDAKSWRNICFYNYTWKKNDNIHKFPITSTLLNKIPNLTYASMNILEPNTEIKPHRGDTNTTIRYHLGILIPEGLPKCGIKVNNIDKDWTEGDFIAFSDAHLHSTWNYTTNYRIIFVIDVMQEQYIHKKRIICTGVLATLTLKHFYYKFNTSKKPPKIIIDLMHKILWLVWYSYLSLLHYLKI